MSQTRGYQPNPLTGVAGSGRVDNTTLAFFGETPTTQHSHITPPPPDLTGLRAAITDMLATLEEYGLIADS